MAADDGHKVTMASKQSGLIGAAALWPTATVRDHKGSGPATVRTDGRSRMDMLGFVAERGWMTPRVATGAYTRDGGAKGSERPTLEGQARLWSTPRASDGEKGGPNQAFSAGGEPLPAMACRHGRQDPETLTDGVPSSSASPRLNPLFVEWLMGWPAGWTLMALPGSTGFACSATGLCRWSQAMRSELSQLAPPVQAMPLQASLFA
ncbi:MAG TPA: hypothetical protein PLG99_13615 [Kaistiaceae bacterium]|nr:hypothetical protein [Kaistiaceae bacterium]